ncbi:hypothetical protein [Telluribacter humicola]|uniref:hypothetical protein n=1 Tax=Telluribacter humicola TaxID=1720261 RepID=UPI001A96C594|nr:hypothetical protein [Telluribacter humicola]
MKNFYELFSSKLDLVLQGQYSLHLWKGLFVMLIVVSYSNVNAQDRIIRNDGEEIKAKVLSEDDTYIKYKRFDNPNGPEYFLYKKDVKDIVYEPKPGKPISNAPRYTIEELERNASKYKRKQLLFSSIGAGAVVAGVATFFTVQGNYNKYKSQLEQTNREFSSWYTQNYNREPNASDLARPKSLTAFGSPGIYLAAAGIAGGVVFELLGIRNGSLRRKTLKEMEQGRTQASFQPYYNPTTRTAGVGLTLKF